MTNNTVLLQLTQLYRVFYRANVRNESSNQSVLKPLMIAKEAILQCRFTSLEELTQVISARLNKTLFSITVSNADGYTLIDDFDTRNKAVEDFARYYVKEVFCWYLHSNKASLNTELDVLEDTVAHLYRIEQRKESDSFQIQEVTPFIESSFDYNIFLLSKGKILITLPNLLEITLTNFSVAKTVKDELQGTDFIRVVSCSYPLDGDYILLTTKELLESIKLPSSLLSNTFLQIVIVSQNTEEETITTESKLWIGNSVSMIIPYEFARKLQHFLYTGNLTYDYV